MIAAARQPAFVAHAPDFDEVTGDCPRLSRLAEVDAHEGPVYFADEHALYFTTLPRPRADRTPSVQIKRLALADPAYGHLQGFRPEPMLGEFVYRHDPATGQTEVVADGFDKPNGIAFSPDERVLYVTDSGANQEPGSYHVNRPRGAERALLLITTDSAVWAAALAAKGA